MLLLVAVVAACAGVTASLGLHPILGGFLAGLVWPGRHPAASAATARVAALTGPVLLPVYFLNFGIGLDLGVLRMDGRTIGTTVAVLGLAVVTKLAAPFRCRRVTGMPARESLTVGVLLNARGLTELVVLQVGRQQHIIDERLFAMLTVVTLVTTVLPAPVLSRLRGQTDLFQTAAPSEETRTPTR